MRLGKANFQDTLRDTYKIDVTEWWKVNWLLDIEHKLTEFIKAKDYTVGCDHLL